VIEFQGKSDAITAALRELIITGSIQPGSPLRQRDLAARFGVSATPVREALRRLEAEGLVHHDLHRGVTVIDTSFDADEEGYRVRAALESMAARAAARHITDEDLEELEALNAEIAARDPADPHVTELNRQFHFCIYEAARSPFLLALLRLLWQSLGRAPHLMQVDSADQHAGIVRALRARDAAAAERLTRDHILGALAVFLSDRKVGTGMEAAGGTAAS
jgi:DNA-binding GntR family transcriptional regulator